MKIQSLYNIFVNATRKSGKTSSSQIVKHNKLNAFSSTLCLAGLVTDAFFYCAVVWIVQQVERSKLPSKTIGQTFWRIAKCAGNDYPVNPRPSCVREIIRYGLPTEHAKVYMGCWGKWMPCKRLNELSIILKSLASLRMKGYKGNYALNINKTTIK